MSPVIKGKGAAVQANRPMHRIPEEELAWREMHYRLIKYVRENRNVSSY